MRGEGYKGHPDKAAYLDYERKLAREEAIPDDAPAAIAPPPEPAKPKGGERD